MSLKAAWPARWSNRKESEITWFFNSLPINDSCIWDCNINVQNIGKMENKTTLAQVLVFGRRGQPTSSNPRLKTF